MLAHGRGGPHCVIKLYRVSTAEQSQSGLGLEAQQASVRVFAEAQGWTLIAEYSDIASGKDDRRQPSRQHWLATGSLVRCLPPPGSTGSPGGRTPSRSCWRMATRQAADMPGADDLMMRIYAIAA
jgi:hypothetical protein